MSPPKMRVAICGAGVGGLICAVALSRYHDIEVDLYEAANSFTAPGAGIGVWPRAWKILSALGLADALSKVAVVPPNELPKIEFNLRKSDQPEGVYFQNLTTPGSFLPFTLLAHPCTPPPLTAAPHTPAALPLRNSSLTPPLLPEAGLLAIQRPDFATVLLQHLSPRARAHAGKRLTGYRQVRSHALVLEFADGARAAADVLVGADGVRSVVRAALCAELAAERGAGVDGLDADDAGRAAERVGALGDASFSGTVAYRAMVPAEAVGATMPGHPALENAIMYMGKDSQITVYPVAFGSYISLTAYRSNYELEGSPPFEDPWTEDVAAADLMADYETWEPEVRSLIQGLQHAHVNKWAIHTTQPLPSMVSGHVVLLGDAAHAMLPHTGAGAGVAIEDAYVLATLLGDRRTTRGTVARALRAYDAVRRPFAARVQDGARENGLLCSLCYPGLTFDRPVAAAASGTDADGGEDEDEDEDGEKLAEIRARVRMNWEWAWKATVDVDLVKALRMLEDR
ncbi:FAD/NAD(P)-binding domain-containing protein [Epithele typhae]|uniref:FAD/NAD(P)-binding domain-containing protein n=1 Tax=Epithele typhae TaxID=378194 RepID=UPI002008B9CD|nr:FAD/NAD(P)-binding domain-containing protein [Epithele typhae]KAH9940802.1 FAD/NAD(P)-binding domain-containing protein [Epithele typhae]